MFPFKKKKAKVGFSVAFIGGKGTDKGAYNKGDEPDEESDDETMDVASASKASAFKDLVTALGGNPKEIDLEAGVEALDAYLEACGESDE